MAFEEFREAIDRVSAVFRKVPKDKKVKLVTNYDADGISAGAILARMLERDGRKYDVEILAQLKEDLIERMGGEEYEVFLFSDFGSGQLEALNRCLKGKIVFVMDHHDIQGEAEEWIHQLNPHLFGIDDDKAISGSGVSYLFAKAVDDRNRDMAHVAIIGAIGDVQENDGFTGLNCELLADAVAGGRIVVERGPRLFGLQTRDIHKLLEYGSDLKIPGVTGNESGAVAFLQGLGIDVRNGCGFRKYADLSVEERDRLIAGIVMRRQRLDRPEDILTNVYRIVGETGLFSDAKEVSTLLNACGRLDRGELGLGVCLNDAVKKREALEHMKDYRRMIVKGIQWYHRNKKGDRVLRGDNYMIVNAGSDVLHTIIGTIMSIVSKSGDFEDGFYLMGLARNPDDGLTKVSLRVTGNDPSIDLKSIVVDLVGVTGGEAGGHQFACGANIPVDVEDEFIRLAEKRFGELCVLK